MFPFFMTTLAMSSQCSDKYLVSIICFTAPRHCKLHEIFLHTPKHITQYSTNFTDGSNIGIRLLFRINVVVQQ